jgi:uncharacterized protein DUF6745
LSAPARRSTALLPDHRRPASPRSEHWRRAAEIRREWLEVGLSTTPADRSTTEEAIASIYAGHRRARPAFLWVDSPAAALPHLTGAPTHETLRAWVSDRPPSGKPPIASDIAAGLSHLRSALAEDYAEPVADRPLLKRTKEKPWPRLPSAEALAAGLPFQELLRQGVREALYRSLAEGVYLPVRAALGAGAALPVGWYGHQDAAWVAHLDVLRRLGLVPAHHGAAFETWLTVARSAGWWFPDEGRCVLVERPAVIRTEPVPGAWHDEVRLRRDPGKPAIEYRDGWSI